MAMEARGVSGVVLYGYHTIARLAQWHLDQHGCLQATAEIVNAFYCDQASRVGIRLDVGRSQWTWANAVVRQWGQPSVFVVDGRPDIRR